MAVAHGGWRGVLGGIVQQAGRAMIGPPATAVIGPSIGPCCFTVGEEVAAAFAVRFGSRVVNASAGVARVDLWEAVTMAVVELGVPRGQVVNPRLCTVCNADLFYSYRKEGPVTGRHGCLAWAGRFPVNIPAERLRANLKTVERRIDEACARAGADATVPGCWWRRSTGMLTKWLRSPGQESGWWGRTGQMSW